MLQLRDFQQQASAQVTHRFLQYQANPSMAGTAQNLRRVPFFQALAAITASGKTVMLADMVSAMCAGVPIPPVVLWLSKGRVVVAQTLAKLSPGGTYHHLLGHMGVAPLSQYDAQAVREATVPQLFIATVGTFNQKDREKSDLTIFSAGDLDTADRSIWESMKVRTDEQGVRRPLLIVYDEAQNLSDQQTDLLLELQPDAFVVASATMKIPAKLSEEIKRLKSDGWTDEELVTSVDPSAVVEAGLIKSSVVMAGYEAPMEETVAAMLGALRETSAEAIAAGIGEPKAIYVCKTNIVEGDAYRRDNPKQPFVSREAPPIVIWRYLTDQGVDPESIAVYCNLKFDRAYPPPAEFHLFSNGDKDYSNFVEGDYRHIIFNLGLQEGWDDPLCYFAYIDKSMESNVAIEQVIGRLLRQPGTTYYPMPRLNAAHFYVRVDQRKTFKDVLKLVGEKLESEAPEVRLVDAPPGKPQPTPLQPRQTLTVYETAYDTSLAVEPISRLLDNMPDWGGDTVNTRASGGRTIVQRNIATDAEPEMVWEEFEHTNLVTARWLFQREVMRRFPGALGVAPTNHSKFDAMVGFNSPAHEQILVTAAQVVDLYVDNVVLRQKRLDPYEVGPVLVRVEQMTPFENSAHAGYDGLNPTLELPFAEALDKTGHTWCRNPSRSGYGIPLITLGPTKNFFPDFLVWLGDDVFAIDTTAPHLLLEKTGRKLLTIAPPKSAPGRLVVRFVSEGRYNSDVERVDKEGYTVWGLKQDQTLRAAHVDDMDQAIKRSLQPL